MANGDLLYPVPPPEVDPWSYGLYDAATVVTEPSGHWARAGFSFETHNCATAGLWEYDECFTPDPPDAVKEIDPGLDRMTSTQPLAVYSGVACTMIGVGDAEAKARARLLNADQQLIERYLWDRVLAAQATDLTPEGGIGLPGGLGLLQHRMRWHYTGPGILHAPSWVQPYVHDRALPTEPARTTRLGTRWAFGAGYDIDAATGEPAVPSGTATLYITGAVIVRQSEVFVPATAATGAFHPQTNLLQVIAERFVAVALDCAGPWSVTVTLPGGA